MKKKTSDIQPLSTRDAYCMSKVLPKLFDAGMVFDNLWSRRNAMEQRNHLADTINSVCEALQDATAKMRVAPKDLCEDEDDED